MYGQDRNAMRHVFFEAWRKQQASLPLEPLEAMIAKIIELHPEYHAVLMNDENLDRDYLPELGETNPFLHMSFHLAVQEQLSTNRPTGINELFQKLLGKYADAHEAEHKIMECLSETIWQVQQNQAPFDEQQYLRCIKKRL